MMYCALARLLTSGVPERSREFAELPIRLISTDTGMQAVEALRTEHVIDAMVSRWDLPDMSDGELVRRIRSARPWLPTVVLLDEPYDQREIAVRGLGVVAVLPSRVEADLLHRVTKQMLGLEALAGTV